MTYYGYKRDWTDEFLAFIVGCLMLFVLFIIVVFAGAVLKCILTTELCLESAEVMVPERTVYMCDYGECQQRFAKYSEIQPAHKEMQCVSKKTVWRWE